MQRGFQGMFGAAILRIAPDKSRAVDDAAGRAASGPVPVLRGGSALDPGR
jgi:hypothetical protein